MGVIRLKCPVCNKGLRINHVSMNDNPLSVLCPLCDYGFKLNFSEPLNVSRGDNYMPRGNGLNVSRDNSLSSLNVSRGNDLSSLNVSRGNGLLVNVSPVNNKIDKNIVVPCDVTCLKCGHVWLYKGGVKCRVRCPVCRSTHNQFNRDVFGKWLLK